MNHTPGQGIDDQRFEKTLSIEVTTDCNSSCSHCFVRAGIAEPASLSVGLVKDIVTEGYHSAFRQLHITGGEPLLWGGLFEVLDWAFNLGYETVFLNTNGKLLSKAVSAQLASYGGVSVSISLEGPEALHDRTRGKGSYRQTVPSIEKALDAGLSLSIFTTARKSLLADLPNFIDETYKRFPCIKYLILIQLIRVKNDKFDLSKELLGPDDFLQLVLVTALLNLYGLKTSVLSNPLACVASMLMKMPWMPKSHPLNRNGSVFVKADGAITLSHSSGSSFGKYEQGMIEKVLASGEYRDTIAPDRETCPVCKYAAVCRENGMDRPSEWFRDMHPEVPYCKRVLDRAATF